MLNHLHKQIEQVLPIYGLYQEAEGDISVQYKEEPTPEQLVEVEKLISDWPLEEAKLQQEEQIDNAVKEVEVAGYDTGKGYKIDLSSKGAADLTGAVVLAKEAIFGGYEGDHYILDSEGLTQSVTYEELIEVSLEYGAARNALYILASQQTRTVRSAKTVKEVRSVALPED